jgi:putative transposase
LLKLTDFGIYTKRECWGRCQDIIFVERLWWTLKHHYLYLHAFDSGIELREGLTEWIRFYNHERGLTYLDDRTPDEVYCDMLHPFAEAA